MVLETSATTSASSCAGGASFSPPADKNVTAGSCNIPVSPLGNVDSVSTSWPSTFLKNVQLIYNIIVSGEPAPLASPF